MTAVFVDTSFLLGLVLADDELHERALAWQRAVTAPVLTTEYVLVEFVDALCSERLRRLAGRTVSLLRADPLVQIVPASTALFEEGLSLFGDRPDKSWGLTDCVSFQVMRRDGLADALTADRHFEQAGFRALLRMDPPS